MNLSKSKYILFCQCPKALWLKTFRPQVATENPQLHEKIEVGNEIGKLARGLFGEYTDVTVKRPDMTLDLNEMVIRTENCIENGTNVICEASFSYEGNYCAVDILKKSNDGYEIYEVKSSSYDNQKADKQKLEIYIPDVSYQKWILSKCGIKVTGTYLVCLNSNYVRYGSIDVNRLFCINNIDKQVSKYIEDNIESSIISAKDCLLMQKEPDIHISGNCRKPEICSFWEYCTRKYPKPSVLDLYRMPIKKKIKYIEKGKISFADMQTERLTSIQKIQVESTLKKKERIDKKVIREFLGFLTFPLYFLDFETIQPAIPEFDGTKPYQQIPFQYSLHILGQDGATLLHKEFLGNPEADPRYELACQLCKEIPMNSCILAYNKSFECSRITELAEAFPDLANHLMNIAGNIKDLLDPFSHGAYYLPAMDGSFSIKKVLPALFPKDKKLNYHNLDKMVQNGGDAMSIFPKMAKMNDIEKSAARKALLEYCCLDTLAMVKIYQKLKEISERMTQ